MTVAISVKHLNPRQGITTHPGERDDVRFLSSFCVKHLNPRQGITTQDGGGGRFGHGPSLCETPQSPPGDYNSVLERL